MSQPVTEQVASLLGAYDLGEVAEVVPLAGRHLNQPHVISAARGRFFAKLLVPELTSAPGLDLRHAFVEHLANRGVAVPRTVRTRGGATYVRCGNRALELFEFVPGRSPAAGNAADAEAAGKGLGELHVAGGHLPPASLGPRRDLPGLQAALDKLSRLDGQMRTYLPAPEVLAKVEPVKVALSGSAAALRAADLPIGLCHGDYVAANLVYAGDAGPCVTDFDEAQQGPLLLDLATAIVSFAGLAEPEFGVAFDPDVARAVARGYARVRPLADAERRALYPCLVGAILGRHLQAGTGPERLAAISATWKERRGAVEALVTPSAVRDP